ncbi:hypothetical protein PPV_Vac110-fpv074 [Avipoxvirus sp.]|nr:hypothetical protein PPV_Vac110-fpv074 [Avipoxvirus sp.]
MIDTSIYLAILSSFIAVIMNNISLPLTAIFIITMYVIHIRLAINIMFLYILSWIIDINILIIIFLGIIFMRKTGKNLNNYIRTRKSSRKITRYTVLLLDKEKPN